jgi:D-glycero-alpha-D-manno-heptose-7-phosphate kinase
MIISRTPFRISFFGGGTDYPVWYEKHGGEVLSTTIDKYCYVTCRRYPPFFQDKVRIVWSKIELVEHAGQIENPVAREALLYLNLQKNIEIHHAADLPAKSGLGASSSFAVGLLNALYALLGKEVTKAQLASEAIHIERERAKENVGSQDQVAVAFGGLNKIIFHPSGNIEVVPVSIRADVLGGLRDRLLLFFTGLSRSASEIASVQIKNTPQKEKELEAMRAMVDPGISFLEKGMLDDFGKLLHESWQLKRGLSPLIANGHIDGIYEAARSAGALGGKLLGAGGGGFMLIYADPARHAAIKAKLSKFLFVPFEFENEGSQVIHRSGGALESVHFS